MEKLVKEKIRFIVIDASLGSYLKFSSWLRCLPAMWPTYFTSLNLSFLTSKMGMK